MTASNRNVLVTVPFFDDDTRAYLESQDCQLSIREKSDADLKPEQCIGLLQGMGGWIVGHARVTREVLEASPSLSIIARRGVGYERVDVAAAAELGRVVTIAAGGNAPSVADQTIGLMIATGRRFHESQRQMTRGDWEILVGTELYQKTVGLIGFGRISRLVAKRLAGFEARILIHTAEPNPEIVKGAELVDLNTLLKRSDYVSLHVPLTPETQNMIDKSALEAMKSSSILINTSRGGLIDEAALLETLRNGGIRGAALDVFHAESDPSHRPTVDELLKLPNFVATPHAAGSTEEALSRSNLLAARSIVAVLNGASPEKDCIVSDGR